MLPLEIIKHGTAVKFSGTNNKSLLISDLCKVVFLIITYIYQKKEENKNSLSPL